MTLVGVLGNVGGTRYSVRKVDSLVVRARVHYDEAGCIIGHWAGEIVLQNPTLLSNPPFPMVCGPETVNCPNV